jgi:hypothetical protein
MYIIIFPPIEKSDLKILEKIKNGAFFSQEGN